MAFTLAQRLDYYRHHPEKWSAIVRRYRARKRRQAEIEGAKQSLLSAARLRAVGVTIVPRGHTGGFDSWKK